MERNIDPDIVKTTIRVPKDTLHKAQYQLKQEGKSVNSFVVEKLEGLVEDTQVQSD